VLAINHAAYSPNGLTQNHADRAGVEALPDRHSLPQTIRAAGDDSADNPAVDGDASLIHAENTAETSDLPPVLGGEQRPRADDATDNRRNCHGERVLLDEAFAPGHEHRDVDAGGYAEGDEQAMPGKHQPADVSDLGIDPYLDSERR